MREWLAGERCEPFPPNGRVVWYFFVQNAQKILNNFFTKNFVKNAQKILNNFFLKFCAKCTKNFK